MIKVAIACMFLVSLACAGKNTPNINEYLNFDNYEDTTVFLPKDFVLPDVQYTIKKKLLVSQKELLQKDLKHEITGKAFDFIFDQDVINMWKYSKNNYPNSDPYNRMIFIRDYKKGFRIYYYGKLLLQEGFRSFLVLLHGPGEEETENYLPQVIRGIYLFNVSKDNRLLSVIDVSAYFSADGFTSYTYTRISGKGQFDQITETLSSDVILPGKFRPEVVGRFILDKDGYVRLR